MGHINLSINAEEKGLRSLGWINHSRAHLDLLAPSLLCCCWIKRPLWVLKGWITPLACCRMASVMCVCWVGVAGSRAGWFEGVGWLWEKQRHISFPSVPNNLASPCHWGQWCFQSHSEALGDTREEEEQLKCFLFVLLISVSNHFFKTFGASGMSHLFCNSKATLSIYLSLEDSHWICRKVKSSDSKSNSVLQVLHLLLFSGQLLGFFSVPLFLHRAHLFVFGSEAPQCSVSQNCPALRTLLHNTASEMAFGYQCPWPLPDSIQMQFFTSSV